MLLQCTLLAALALAAPASDLDALQGLWSGSWGGEAREGVVFTPVISELVVEGDHVELAGFPDLVRLSGTVRIDADVGFLRITPEADSPAPRAVEFPYKLEGDSLAITPGNRPPLTLKRLPAKRNTRALLQSHPEIMEATGFDDEGNLLVTQYRNVRVTRGGATYYEPWSHPLNTRGASIFLVEDAGLKTTTLEEARRHLAEPAPVAILFNHDDAPESPQPSLLWKESWWPSADSEEVQKSLARALRPGTLLFVISSKANVPQP